MLPPFITFTELLRYQCSIKYKIKFFAFSPSCPGEGKSHLPIYFSLCRYYTTFNQPAYKMHISGHIQTPPPPLYAFVCIRVDPPTPPRCVHN